MQKLEENSTKCGVTMAVLAYSLCSGTLLLANKMCIEHLPRPSVVSFIQIVSTAIACIVMKILGVKIDALEWDKLKAYSMYIIAFVSAIFANMQALSVSNVETVIVFRACSPIAVSVVEYLFMDREIPSLRSICSLSMVAGGAILYCMSDSEFSMNGFSAYKWVVIYFVLITFEMTYGKLLTSSVKMESVWGPVFYCNLLAAFPMFLAGWWWGDFENIGELMADISANGMLILMFSCVTGTLIGYTGWLCRGMISATSYTLVGVVNKFLTIVLNVLVWDKHSSPMGLFAVTVCLGSGMFYQQAPKRKTRAELIEMQTQQDRDDRERLLRSKA